MEISKADNVIKILREYDDSFTIYVNREDIMYANHDRHGWAGMEALETLAERIASSLDVEFVIEYQESNVDD